MIYIFLLVLWRGVQIFVKSFLQKDRLNATHRSEMFEC